jgi:hypothetical protein
MGQSYPGDRLPWGTTAEGELSRKGLVAASVMGTLAIFLTLPLGVLAIVLNAMGLQRIKSNPPLARKLVTWSWILFIPGTVLGVVGGALLIGTLILT